MNVNEFKSNGKSICFCLVDNTHIYNNWARELSKNQADYTITNIYFKGYDLFQGLNEDELLNYVSDLPYTHCVVFSTGTEFINGNNFFNCIEQLAKTDIVLYGHVLDRGDAYYELHNQCYLINLSVYKILNKPSIGKESLGERHLKTIPKRSQDNIHDDYTPLFIEPGTEHKEYSHKLHGYNIISVLLDNGYRIEAFDNIIRSHKKHFYPENNNEFLKHLSWANARLSYCNNQFVHKEHTEHFYYSEIPDNIEQIVTPASGSWFDKITLSNPVTVIYYDYNQSALDYWQQHKPNIPNVTYKFVLCDLLGIDKLTNHIDDKLKTVVNLSNIFAYEGTSMFYSLEYRLSKENQLLNDLNSIKDCYIMFSGRACSGFVPLLNRGYNLKPTVLSAIKKPTWHSNGDWN